MQAVKSIVITGASSGIGAALTRAFAGDGHRLFVCARRAERLAEVTKGLASARYAVCDVCSEADVRRFFAEAGKALPSIDVLIHCAAVMGPVGPVIDTDSAAWFDALKTDLFGAFLVVKHAAPLMKPERRPRILLLSGGGAFDPMPNLSAYGVSKAAIVRFAETLAVELKPRNIAVNVFAPGFVATDIFSTLLSAGRDRGGILYDTVVNLLNEWEDGDIDLPLDCARYLISDESAGLTGKTISARFDPWDQPEFRDCMAEIARSRLYTTQRTSLEHMAGEPFVERLRVAQKNAPRRHRKPPFGPRK